ncbi:hypothetical protein Plec18167_006169 [Paecilomyces lecythidis]|uniref:Uncharacterized protein n=1 Tax=Paecilomyces lecythidis TaxID=3004212 RepID=A0ABR3XD76_9EURO
MNLEPDTPAEGPSHARASPSDVVHIPIQEQVRSSQQVECTSINVQQSRSRDVSEEYNEQSIPSCSDSIESYTIPGAKDVTLNIQNTSEGQGDTNNNESLMFSDHSIQDTVYRSLQTGRRHSTGFTSAQSAFQSRPHHDSRHVYDRDTQPGNTSLGMTDIPGTPVDRRNSAQVEQAQALPDSSRDGISKNYLGPDVNLERALGSVHIEEVLESVPNPLPAFSTSINETSPDWGQIFSRALADAPELEGSSTDISLANPLPPIQAGSYSTAARWDDTSLNSHERMDPEDWFGYSIPVSNPLPPFQSAAENGFLPWDPSFNAADANFPRSYYPEGNSVPNPLPPLHSESPSVFPNWNDGLNVM